jgi:Tol biopolymer transport system component
MGMSGLAAASIVLAVAISTSPIGQSSAPDNSLPSNLKAGVFQPVVEKMWQASPTFRRQCERLAAERSLTVRLRAEGFHASTATRARTEISRTGASLTFADVVVLDSRDAIELIAHEIEHLIEQIDGVQLTRDGCGGGGSREGPSETCRAIEAGRQVAREVSEARAIRISTLQQRDRFSGPRDAPTAAIGASGRFVVFRSTARLTPDDTTDDADLYVLTVETGALQLATRHPGWADAYRGFLEPAISSDGRIVVFRGVTADPVTAGNVRWRIVVLDRIAATAHTLAVEPGAPARDHGMSAISADGTTVAFESMTRDEGQFHLYVARLETMTVEEIGVGAAPAVSADGRYIAFISAADSWCAPTEECRQDPRRRVDVFVRDTVKHVTRRVSRSRTGGNANGSSSWPAISTDGRYVAFTSDASNLVAEDHNGQADVFVSDVATGTTDLVSRRADGRVGNQASGYPAISGDGSIVAFQSLASDLLCVTRCAPAGRDINLVWDVFVFDRRSGEMIRASADAAGEWMETSRRPSIDESGHSLVFSSRHSIGGEDVDHDDDLYLWMRGRPAPVSARR